MCVSCSVLSMGKSMARPFEQTKIMRQVRIRQGLCEVRLVVPDLHSPAVRRRVERQVIALDPDRERDAVK